MKNPIIANAVPEEKKKIIFDMDTSKGAERLIREYVDAFIEENHLWGLMLPAQPKKILIPAAIYAVVLFLNTVWHCFYGEVLTINLIIFAVSTIALVAYDKKNKTSSDLKAQLTSEIIQRPSTPMDDVLISQVSGAVSVKKVKMIRAGILLGTVLVLCLLFLKPHMIFERNNLGGYSLRYYTDSIIKESNVVIPDTRDGLPVNEIRGSVFYGFWKMNSVELPDGLREIRADTFRNCRGLRCVHIPDGVTRIGAHAFHSCTALFNVYVPDSVTSIGSSAFRDCPSLRSISLPAGCDYEKNTFKGSETSILWR